MIPMRQVQPKAVRMTAGLQRVLTQSSDHAQYCANSSRCWLSISCASNVETPSRPASVTRRHAVLRRQQHDLVSVAHRRVRCLGGRLRHRTDALGEAQIGIAGTIHVEHVVDRAAVSVGQRLPQS